MCKVNVDVKYFFENLIFSWKSWTVTQEFWKNIINIHDKKMINLCEKKCDFSTIIVSRVVIYYNIFNRQNSPSYVLKNSRIPRGKARAFRVCKQG